MSYEGMKKGIDLISSDSDDDDRAGKPRVLLADQFRSKSPPNHYRRRAGKVWAVSVEEKKQEEPQKLVPESRSESEERVGDIVRFGKSSHFIIDIFEKEIMELGDKVDLNFKRFNKFEAKDGDAPRDHHFYDYRCCYSPWCCVCASRNVEKEWKILEREITYGFSKGVSFFVRSYKERKELMRVAVTVTNGDDESYSLFFFDIKFPTEYPNRPPSYFYHPYGFPRETFDSAEFDGRA